MTRNPPRTDRNGRSGRAKARAAGKSARPPARKRLGKLIAMVHRALTAMEQVTTNQQWGGRIYKLGEHREAADRRRRSGKLLAFCYVDDDRTVLFVDFKLAPQHRGELNECDFLFPHDFKTLARSGWVTAQLSNQRDARRCLKLLRATHRILTGSGSGK